MDSQRNTSLESLTKVPSPSDTASSVASSKKDARDKKKDKNKGGMLSGLFKSKKKEKKGSKDEDGFGEEKTSMEMARGASPASNSSPIERNSVPAGNSREMQVQSRGVAGRPISAPIVQQPVKPQAKPYPMAELQGSEAAYEMVGTMPDTGETRTPKVKRSKERMELDDFDSPGDRTGPNPFDDEEADEPTASHSGTIVGGMDFVHIPTSFAENDDEVEESPAAQHHPLTPVPTKESVDSHADVEDERDVFTDARESTTSPTTALEANTMQPLTKTTLQDDGSASSRTSSLGEAETPKSATPTASHDGKHNWDDGALRAWLDAEEVKDMLTIVHASARLSGTVVPVSDDHPLMRGLYAEERGAVERMMGELDNLMLGWAGRKGLAL